MLGLNFICFPGYQQVPDKFPQKDFRAPNVKMLHIGGWVVELVKAACLWASGVGGLDLNPCQTWLPSGRCSVLPLTLAVPYDLSCCGA